jgi:MYXO-CTERM domain-containing protein
MGHYELDGIPGTAKVTVKAPGYAPASVDVTVTKGTMTTVSIALTIDPMADFDGDGVPDAHDNCIQVANADQGDADGDSIGDACDMDDDGDGLADEDDNCPFVANPDQADRDGNGVGDLCVPDSSLLGGCSAGGPGSPWGSVLGLFVVAMVCRRRRRCSP